MMRNIIHVTFITLHICYIVKNCKQLFFNIDKYKSKIIIKAVLWIPMRYPINLLYDEFRVLNAKQLFIKIVIFYLRNHKNKLFTVVKHNYRTRNQNNFGFHIPRAQHSVDEVHSYYICWTLLGLCRLRLLRLKGLLYLPTISVQLMSTWNAKAVTLWLIWRF